MGSDKIAAEVTGKSDQTGSRLRCPGRGCSGSENGEGLVRGNETLVAVTHMKIKDMLKAFVIILSCFVFTRGAGQPALQARIRTYPLLANQSFIEDTISRTLSLVNLVNPEQFSEVDSIRGEALLSAIRLRKDVVGSDVGALRHMQIIYVNRYCYDLDQAFLYRFQVKAYSQTNPLAADSLPGLGKIQESRPLGTDSLLGDPVYRRECRYPLAANEFLLRGDFRAGFILELFKNVDLGPLQAKGDSLEDASRVRARGIFLDVVREDCGKCVRVSVTFQDRHFVQHTMGWVYKVEGCWFNDAGEWVGRLSGSWVKGGQSNIAY